MLTLRRLPLWPLVGCFAYRVVVGVVATFPWVALATRVVAGHPRGDRLLWEPGGMWLVESARVVAPQARAFDLVWLFLAAFGWLVPLGALIAALDPALPGARYRELVARAAGRLGALSLAWGSSLVFMALPLAAAHAAAPGVAGWLERDQTALAAQAVVWLVGAAVAWLVAVIHDAVRVGLLQRGLPLKASALLALEVVITRPIAVLARALWCTLVVLASFGWAFGIGLAFTAGRHDAPIVVALANLVAVAVLVVMRAEWLAWLSGAVRRRASPLLDADDEPREVS
jgi:hypothetical protein